MNSRTQRHHLATNANQLAQANAILLRMKVCSRCKEKKPLDQFYRKKGRDATAYCKPCQHEYLREYYRRTITTKRARRYELAEKYTTRNRRLVLAYLAGHPCVDCGEADVMVLEFDHVRGVKENDIARMIGDCFSTNRIEAEIAKCVVRCANCHRRKTMFERNTYRTLRPSGIDVRNAPPGAAKQRAFWDGWGSNPRPIG